jgi:putative tryptophan/tyrosine transport system substrate-binding protein
LLGGTAAAWPLSARAQQSERVRRVGVLANLLENDPEAMARLTAFRRSLGELGWVEGRNLQIDVRSGVDNDRIRKNATELIALAPDVILANAPPSVMALQQATRTVPIVFVNMTDPVGMGIVQSLARPGGNATGFTVAEFSLSAKWLEVLKEIAPGVRRVAVLRELSNPSALPQFAAIQAVASSFDVELSPQDGHTPHARRDLFEYLHPFRAQDELGHGKAGGVAARPRAVGEAANYWLPGFKHCFDPEPMDRRFF